ncbi:MAG: hypothetical protein R2991_05155 [Thermoanaerobaculia bacterium]
MIGANLPDVDVAAYFVGPDAALALSPGMDSTVCRRWRWCGCPS